MHSATLFYAIPHRSTFRKNRSKGIDEDDTCERLKDTLGAFSEEERKGYISNVIAPRNSKKFDGDLMHFYAFQSV